jgi:toxin ParE1/3/4
MRIRWTPTAAADLQSIYDYLKEHEPHLARPTIIEIRKPVRSLKKFPLRGRQGREEGTRELLHRRLPHIIAYPTVLGGLGFAPNKRVILG